MMANVPFGGRASSLLEDLKSPDNGVQHINSGLSSLSFNTTTSQGVIKKPDAPIRISSVVPQEQSPYYPSSPMPRSPNIHQQSRSVGEFPQAMAPTSNFTASPFIYEERTFSPSLNTPVSSDGRSSHSSGKNQHDPLGSFFPPPPPNLETSADVSQRIGFSDNTGLFLDNQPQSPFVSTPRHRSNLDDLNRERPLQSPGNYLRQSSLGAVSPPPAPLGQILYENKPSSWNEGSRVSAPSLYKEAALPSPSNFDRFNSRPPRHGGTNDTQALVSPRIEIRHTASDGNFHNFPSAVPIFNPMSPVAVAHNQGQSQSNIATAAIGSPNFDSSIQAHHDGSSFRSMNTLNNSINFIQYPNPGNSNCAHVQQDTYFVQQSPAPPTLQRHNSTGSQHFLVNERGEIVGHASPVITHNSLEARIVGFTPGEPKNRVNSYGGQHASQFTPNFNPIPFQNGRSQHNIISSPMDNHVGSVGDGRMQHKPTVFNPHSGGITHSRHPVSATSDAFNQALAEDKTDNIELPSEEIRDSIRVGADEGKASSQSYASKLMMPCPQPVVDQTKGRVSSQLLTAGASLSKSGLRMVFNVKFKRSQKNFVLGHRVTREIRIGCYVKVEADRGEDLGIVMSIVPMAKFLASNRHRSMTEDSIASGDPSPSQTANIGDLKRIMRVATHDEISLLEVKREEEEELLKICCTKVRQRGLLMSVVDAEYQYDRNKLTFFFQAEGRIDFRELVRDLFSMYKTRIWMQDVSRG